MNIKQHSSASLGEVHGSIDANQKATGWKKIFAWFGPAYLVSVGYMDPGNWATDIAGGSQFGYTLLWVLLMSNLMALLLQSLSSRLGIVRSRDLAQANRETYPQSINFIFYILAEIAIAATDLAEVLGMAIGINLLTGLPLIWGVSLTVLDTFLLLFLQQLGMRKMEAFILGLVAIVSSSFLIEIVLAKPHMSEVIKGFIPHLPNNQALYLAIGIIGATVMPHNLYLHSALVQSRKIQRTDEGIRRAIKFNIWDSTIALNLAFLVNAAILILAAAVFFKTGRTNVGDIQQAHQLLSPLLGSKIAPTIFAIALIAAGQSSTVTGTLAGQIVMEGYLHLRINPWMRRLLTRLLAIAPAVITIYLYGDKEISQLLVLSQVVLSLQLGFAVIPLIHFVSDKQTMGKFAIRHTTQAAAWIIAATLVYLNLRMVFGQTNGIYNQPGHFLTKTIISIGITGFATLLLYAFIHPLRVRHRATKPLRIHATPQTEATFQVPNYNTIAVALDFSSNDDNILSHALGQARPNTSFVLIHVVESVSARIYGNETYDEETKEDQQQLEGYVQRIRTLGYTATGSLGFRYRTKEIVRLVKNANADILVMGAHGHKWFQDLIHGQTVDSVRHELNIPVLVVKV